MKTMKKLTTWNVNGLRACMEKGFLDFVKKEQPDVLALQEIKMLPEQAEIPLEGYTKIWNSAEKKGYSGTAFFTKQQPLNVVVGMDTPRFDCEGRTITLEFDDFYFVTSYTPNAQDGLRRIDYRMDYEDTLRAYLTTLDKTKPVILCGDLNVAHNEIDLKNPKQNEGNAGYSLQERGKMTELLSAGFADIFRRLYPDRVSAYSWWSYRGGARSRNAGWRIDYFICSERFLNRIEDCVIMSDVLGSDHCPVTLYVKEQGDY